MFEFVARLFDPSGFIPRDDSGEWSPALIWLHVGGDLFIWLAYLTGPLVVLYFTRRRDRPYPRFFALWVAFLLVAGFGHLVEALAFHYPLYRLAGLLKVLTAIAAWATVLALIAVLPRVLRSADEAARAGPGAVGDTTLYRLAAPPARERVTDYAVAILAAILAMLLRAALDPVVETDHFFALPLLAVVFVSWQCGFAPAMVTLLLSLLGMTYFFLQPTGSFVVVGLSNQLATAIFFFCGVCCAGLGEAQRVARRGARAALAVALERQAELEIEVARRDAAEEAVRESEARFRSMADSAPAMIWLSDLDRRRTYFNRTWLEFTGRSSEEELGEGWIDNVHPEDRDRYLAAYTEAFETRKPFEIEYRLRRRDGVYRWVLARGTPRFTPSGGFAGFVGLCMDVTDRKRAEEELRRSEKNLSDFFENANVGLHWVAPDGLVIRANRAELEMLGYASEEYVGRHIAGFHDNPETIDDLLARLGRCERLDNYPARLRHKDGTTRDVLISSTALFEDGEFIHSRCFTRDVTELKRAEEELRRSERRFRTLTEAIPQMVWNADASGEVMYFNQRWQEYTGEPLENARGRGWLDAVHPDDRDTVFAAWRDTVDKAAAGEADRFAHELRLKGAASGDYRWFLSVAAPLRRPDGSIDQWIGSMADIHDQKTAAAKIAESEEKFRTMAESIPQLAWMTDAEGYIFWYNQRWYDYTGTTFDEMKGWGWQSVHDPDEVGRVVEKFKAHIASGETWEDTFPLRRHDGEFRWHLSRARPIRDAGGKVVRWFGTNTDITEQRNLERAARAAADRFRTLTETVPQMIWTADPTGEVTSFNHQWDDYTGLPVAPGRVWDWWADVIHPDDLDQLRAEWQLAVARPPEKYSNEFRLRRTADGTYRWMLSAAVPLRDPAGEVVEWVGSITDIDDQKRATENLERVVRERTAELQTVNGVLVEEIEERKRVELQVRAVAAELARSNGELEQFAYVASHDLQEPLRKIQAFGDRLVTRVREQLPETGKEYVDRMLTSAGRMRQLIDDLLTFARVTSQARPFSRVDLGEAAREVASELSVRIEETGGEVRVGEMPVIDADPSQIRQLIQNLVANALKFQRPGVPPLVEVSGELIAKSEESGSPATVCRIAVRDNGIGFDEKYLDRIFQVFQRLHGRDEYEGTGVGLAICRKIVERHGGTITATSRKGEGSTFVVTLPIRQHYLADAPVHEPEG